MEQTTFLSINRDKIEKKENKRIRIKYEYFIFALLGFIMGQAEVLSGFFPFSLIYWSVFIGRSRLLFAIITISTGMGLISTGNYFNIYYLLAGLTGLVITKFVKKVDLYISISLVFFVFSIFLNYYSRALVYQYFFAAGESILIYIMLGFVNEGTEELLSHRERINGLSMVTAFLFSSGVIIGLGSFELIPLSAINILILLIITGIAQVKGFSYSVVTAVLYGVVLVSAGLIPILTMTRYIIFGLVTGLFQRRSKLWLIAGILMAFLVYSGFSPTIYDLKQTVIEFGIATLIFLILPGRFWYQLFNRFKPDSVDISGENKKIEFDLLNDTFKQHLVELSKVFAELSSTFKEVLPDTKEENNIDDFAYIVRSKICRRCPRIKICWQQEKGSTYQGLIELVKVGEEKGNLDKNLITRAFGEICPYIDRVTGNFKNSFELYQINKFWRNRLKDKQKIVSEQLLGIGNIIEEFSSSAKLNHSNKPSLNYVRKRAERGGVEVYKIEQNSSLNSSRMDFNVEMEPCAGNSPCEKVLLPILSSEFSHGYRILEANCGNKLKDRSCDLLIGPKGDYELEMAVNQLPWSGDISGDSYLYKPLRNGKDLIALSDGMGVGKKAARESRAATKLLEKIIEAGFDQDLAIRTINSALYLRNQEESFTTLDIGFFDTFTGEIIFNKIGAVASFIKRGWDVSIIKSASLPVGILNKIEITSQNVQLNNGDFVVIVSDGVLDIRFDLRDKENWIKQILQNSSFDRAEDLCNYLLEVVEKHGDQIRDDITIIVLKIKEISQKSRKLRV